MQSGNRGAKGRRFGLRRWARSASAMVRARCLRLRSGQALGPLVKTRTFGISQLVRGPTVGLRSSDSGDSVWDPCGRAWPQNRRSNFYGKGYMSQVENKVVCGKLLALVVCYQIFGIGDSLWRGWESSRFHHRRGGNPQESSRALPE